MIQPHVKPQLEVLAELQVSDKQIRCLCKTIGNERVAERDAAVAAYQAKPLSGRQQAPADVAAPDVAVVGVDGGGKSSNAAPQRRRLRKKSRTICPCPKPQRPRRVRGRLRAGLRSNNTITTPPMTLQGKATNQGTPGFEMRASTGRVSSMPQTPLYGFPRNAALLSAVIASLSASARRRLSARAGKFQGPPGSCEIAFPVRYPSCPADSRWARADFRGLDS
jgi:hypothetical protein